MLEAVTSRCAPRPAQIGLLCPQRLLPSRRPGATLRMLRRKALLLPPAFPWEASAPCRACPSREHLASAWQWWVLASVHLAPQAPSIHAFNGRIPSPMQVYLVGASNGALWIAAGLPAAGQVWAETGWGRMRTW